MGQAERIVGGTDDSATASKETDMSKDKIPGTQTFIETFQPLGKTFRPPEKATLQPKVAPQRPQPNENQNTSPSVPPPGKDE